MTLKLCGFDVGLAHPFFLISGPCVVESEQLQMDTAGTLKEICAGLGIPFIFKSSYDKANRSSGTSFRGLGMEKGLEILAKVKSTLNVNSFGVTQVVTQVVKSVTELKHHTSIVLGSTFATVVIDQDGPAS